ncbi:lipopolysaccharide biosynthesis protein [Dyella monticola]|nr:oligosaccharide flippase family protein [Dyella monticola]
MRALLRHIPAGNLAKDTLYVAFWQGVRVAGQALWVIVIARILGAKGYGTFTGMVGLATAIGGFTGLGLGLLMLQDAARDPSLFADRWYKALIACLASGTILGVLFIPISGWLFNSYAAWHLGVPIALSEIALLPIVSLAAFAFSARQLMSIAAALSALMASFRVLAALAFWCFVNQRTLETYAWLHACASLMCAALCVLWVKMRLHPGRTSFTLTRRDVTEGLGFSMVWMVNNALASLDKTLVLRLATSEVAGFYAAFYRFATVLALPVEALTMAAGPRLFRHGGGVEKHPLLIVHLLTSALVCGLLMGAFFWAFAGILPWLLGPTFEPAVPVARWMALFVPCYGLRVLGSNILITHDKKRIRVLIEGCGLVTLILTAVLWIPHYGLRGAVAMITTTEAALGVATWLVVWALQKKQST